jgi:hypothetical protein
MQMDTTDLGSKKTTQQEMLLDSNRFRINVDAKTSVLFLTDGGRNRIVMLDKSKNEYHEIDQQTMNQMTQQMTGALAQMQEQLKNLTPEQRAMIEKMMKGKMPQQVAPQRTVYTAKGSATVNGFSCTRYEGVRGGQKVAEVCAAQPSQLKFSPADFQVFEKMKEFSAGLQNSLQNSPLAGAGANFIQDASAGFEGFPVERTTFSDGQPSEKSELKTLQHASLTDADFSVGNAKKVDLPIGRGAAK